MSGVGFTGGGVYCCIYTGPRRVLALTRSNKLLSVSIVFEDVSCVYLLWELFVLAIIAGFSLSMASVSVLESA